MLEDEKINIYVPEYIGTQLDKDASLFEVMKRDGHKINMNRFLSMLIKGYFNSYSEKSHYDHERIVSILHNNGVVSDKVHEIADQILKAVVLPDVPPRKGKNPTRLSLKPTKDTRNLIISIMNDIGRDDYISQYFCRMLMSYCKKALNERERIIFSDNYKILEDACACNRLITFSTIRSPQIIHSVIPYRLAVGREEMFNYLLCAETDPNTGEQQARSYRLNRISGINYGRGNNQIDDRVVSFLEKMIQYGPQFAINDDEEACIRLTERGRDNFRKIYFGRPQVDRVEEREGKYYYYFKGSKDQLFIYFQRLGPDAEILEPLSLRERLASYYLNAYKNNI